jgi:hypothetical protein
VSVAGPISLTVIASPGCIVTKIYHGQFSCQKIPGEHERGWSRCVEEGQMAHLRCEECRQTNVEARLIPLAGGSCLPLRYRRAITTC